MLGTGINTVYPAENAELYERISENGAVLTQFPFNRKGDKQSFPIRNRIVAGMTLGTVVVEADLKSGSLITANMAADNNRQVFAVPGRVDSPQSRGCHNLIARAQSSAKMRMTFSRSSNIWRLAKRTTHPPCPWPTSPRRSKRSSKYWTQSSNKSTRSSTRLASRCRASLWRCWDWK